MEEGNEDVSTTNMVDDVHDKKCTFFCNEHHENELGHELSSQFCVIYKNVLTPGDWGPRPMESALCNMSITNVCISEDTHKEIRDLQLSEYLNTAFEGNITIGEADMVIDRALEQCVQSMLGKEKSVFTIKFPSIKSPEPFDENSTLVETIQCTVLLNSCVNDEIFCDWNDDKIYEKSMHHKTHGVELFKKGKVIEAFLRFGKGFKFLNSINMKTKHESEAEHIKTLRSILLNNMASCQLHFENYQHAINLCSKALAIEQDNIKSLYRRAVSYMNVKMYDEAENDFKKLLEIDPNNSSVKEKYTELKEVTKERNANYASVVKKMFS